MVANLIFLAFIATISNNCFGCTNWNYLKINGFRTNGAWDVRMVVKDAQECVDVCSKQKVCQSLDFESTTKFCYLYPLSNNFTRIASKNFTQYEKICFKDGKIAKCNRTVTVMPQKILIGMATTVTTVKHLDSCVQSCADSRRLFDFECLSGAFYSNVDGENNCILNSQSSQLYPDFLTDEEIEIVDYFELGCDYNDTQNRPKREVTKARLSRHRNVLWPNTPEWGSWTRCDGTGGNRYRYRQCKSMNPNSCQKDTGTCDPTNRAQEMQDIMNEEGGNQNGNSVGQNGMNLVTDQGGLYPISPPVTDNGMIPPVTNGGAAPLPTDSGMVQTPLPTDSGMIHPPTDSGMVQPPTGSGLVQPPTDSGMVPLPTDRFGVIQTISGGMIPFQTTLAPGPFGPTDHPHSILVTGGSSQPNFVFVENQPKMVTSSNGNNNAHHNNHKEPKTGPQMAAVLDTPPMSGNSSSSHSNA